MRPKLYLASVSPRRRALLKAARVRFAVLKPRYRETFPRAARPAALVRMHALGKALSAARQVRDGFVLGADTVVFHRNKIIGKPRSMKEASRVLRSLQGVWHRVYTGVALVEIRSGLVLSKKVFVEKTDVKLKKMTKDRSAAYLKKIGPLDKAGAYAIQSRRADIVESVRGSVSNAAGLPMEALKRRCPVLRVMLD